MQQGPTLLVAHSYGGVVITEAGNAPNVSGLVYIAAFIPDKGESAVGLLSQMPAANNDMRATKDDFLYLDPTAFPADFAATAARATGGRDDRSATLDGTFEVSLTTPKELGRPGGNGANPEKLFTAGYKVRQSLARFSPWCCSSPSVRSG